MTDHPHLGKFKLLPPRPGVCQECGSDHPPEMPHNREMMQYQYDFYGKHGRWPKWQDAMAHCTDEVKQKWGEALKVMGIEI